MAKALFIRLASAAGLISLSLFFAALIPVLNANPSIGAGLTFKSPATSVNRAFKSDRLMPPSGVNSALSKNEPQEQKQDSKSVPDGCDRSFSPVAAPQLAYVYGRCTT
jgi:hypothetical protein